jgi:glutathione S-transferase
MKLYYLKGACPLASQIVLEWMNADYTLEEVTPEQTKSPDFLALNPLGSVPVLVDNDFVLSQTVAIMEYLAELHPEAGLHGTTAKERAEVRRWVSFCNSDLHRTFSLVFTPQNFQSTQQGQNELAARAAERVKFLFSVADKRLADREYLAGKRSLADPYLYTVNRWTRALGIDMPDLKNLDAFFNRMAADPGVQNALKRQGLD